MSLEDRVRALEDVAAVARLIAAYGPAADRGAAEEVAALWTEDGTYDVDTGRYEGAAGIAGMVASDAHQALVARGCGHLLTPPAVHVDGDHAVAVGHSLLVLRREGRYDVLRVTASRWECRRTASGWRVDRRTSRLLDGSEQARALLAVDGP